MVINDINLGLGENRFGVEIINQNLTVYALLDRTMIKLRKRSVITMQMLWDLFNLIFQDIIMS